MNAIKTFNPWKPKNWTSNALWPKDSIIQKRANDKTTDFHYTNFQAQAVCNMLKESGMGWEGKIFPLKVWVESKLEINNP